MPRPSNVVRGRAPKMCVNAKGIAFIYVGSDKVYLGKADDPNTERKYHQTCAEMLATGFIAPPSQSTEVLVKELLARFWCWAKGYYTNEDDSPCEELRKYKRAIKLVRPLYAESKVVEFGPRALKTCRKAMIDLGWCRKSVNKHVRLVVSMFKWGVEEELVPGEIVHRLQAVRGLRRGRTNAKESRKVRPVDMALVTPLQPLLPKQVWDLIQLQLLTAARPGELVSIKRGQIDRSVDPWEYRPEHHKTESHGHERVIFFNAKAQEILAPYLLRPDDAYLFSPAEALAELRRQKHEQRKTPMNQGNKPGVRTVPNPKRKPGDHYDLPAYRRAITRACDRAFPLPDDLKRGKVQGDSKPGVRWETEAEWRKRVGEEKWKEVRRWIKSHRWHPHQLRHNAATLIRKRFGLEAARVILGHRSVNVTEIYAELDREKAAEAIKQVV